MRYWFVAVVGLVVLSSAVAGAFEAELVVRRQDGGNVVEGAGRKVEFYLTATRQIGGTQVMQLAVPAGSELAKAPRWRVEVRREGKVVLRSPLQTERGADGTVRASFEVDDSAATGVFVAAVFDPNPLSCAGFGTAYVIPVAEYVRP